MKIDEVSGDAVVDLALDTLKLGKQALVFVNTKRSAEKSAEDIAKHVKGNDEELMLKVLNVLPKPTKQCERLAKCVKKGIAFHHAGLASKQKEIVEDAFREGRIKIICCTTTMAAGMDLPAFRSIIRDLKRYTHHGLDYIPVLEYHQCAGRAGRPGKEDYGEAIVIVKSEEEAEEVTERFIHGKPEEIYSKLAVEPVLRMYVLSLIVTDIATSKEKLNDFFSKTFWAFQYKDMEELRGIIDKMIELLKEWIFLERFSDFESADEFGDEKLVPTKLGERVAQLYIDPLTANYLIKGIAKAKENVKEFEILQLISFTPEMKPLLKVRTREIEDYEEKIAGHNFLCEVPSYFDYEYGDFLNSVKTAEMFMDWIDETDEDILMEKYNIRPGETRYKTEMADWLLYSMKELAIILNKKWLTKEIEKLRIRLKYGVKKELIPLLHLKNIGRVRARKLFARGIKTLGDVRKASINELKDIVGEKIALGIKKQLE